MIHIIDILYLEQCWGAKAGEPEPGSRELRLFTGSRAGARVVKKINGARAIKSYLVGARFGASKNPLRGLFRAGGFF